MKHYQEINFPRLVLFVENDLEMEMTNMQLVEQMIDDIFEEDDHWVASPLGCIKVNIDAS